MKCIQTNLKGVLVIETDAFHDERGYFKEYFHQERYKELGIPENFVQDNHSFSKKGVLRGLHFQEKFPQGKLVTCMSGAVYDVAVDIDPKSPSFRQYFGIELSESNNRQLWIPPGYAHGFCVLSEEAHFHYKCSQKHIPDDERGILWSDEMISIDWPLINPLISAKDSRNPTLSKYLSET